MLTQLKQVQTIPVRERQITLEVHPDIKIKLRMNHYLQKKKQDTQNEPRNAQQNKKQATEDKIIEMQNQSLYFGKYELQNQPKKTKKPVKMSSYQIYKQQQKNLKFSQKDRMQEWKKNYNIKRSFIKTRSESRDYLRTRSFSQRTKNIQLTFNRTGPLLQTLENHNTRKISPNNLKLSYSHSNSPNNKNINLMPRHASNYKKIHFKNKSQLEFKPFSTIPHPLSHRQEPSPPTLQLASSRNSYIKSSYSQRKNSESSNGTTLNSFRKTVTSKIRTKNRETLFDQNACRPWSGNKGQAVQGGDYSVFYL